MNFISTEVLLSSYHHVLRSKADDPNFKERQVTDIYMTKILENLEYELPEELRNSSIEEQLNHLEDLLKEELRSRSYNMQNGINVFEFAFDGWSNSEDRYKTFRVIYEMLKDHSGMKIISIKECWNYSGEILIDLPHTIYP